MSEYQQSGAASLKAFVCQWAYSGCTIENCRLAHNAGEIQCFLCPNGDSCDVKFNGCRFEHKGDEISKESLWKAACSKTVFQTRQKSMVVDDVAKRVYGQLTDEMNESMNNIHDRLEQIEIFKAKEVECIQSVTASAINAIRKSVLPPFIKDPIASVLERLEDNIPEPPDSWSSAAKKSVQCFRCDNFGHVAIDCPEEYCYRCDKVGHVEQDCPKDAYSDELGYTLRNRPKSIACSNCGELGHTFQNCPRDVCNDPECDARCRSGCDDNFDAIMSAFDLECQHCGELDHDYKKCPYVEQESYDNPIYAPSSSDRKDELNSVKFKYNIRFSKKSKQKLPANVKMQFHSVGKDHFPSFATGEYFPWTDEDENQGIMTWMEVEIYSERLCKIKLGKFDQTNMRFIGVFVPGLDLDDYNLKRRILDGHDMGMYYQPIYYHYNKQASLEVVTKDQIGFDCIVRAKRDFGSSYTLRILPVYRGLDDM